MHFGRKLLYYLLGVGLGVLMVAFIFGDRDIQCNYFPNDRVLYDLRKKELTLSESLSAAVNTGNKDTSGLYLALERARVDFDRSQISDEGCNVYFLELDSPTKSFEIENCDSIALVRAVY